MNKHRLTKDNYVDDCFRLQNEKNQLPEYKSNHYTASQYDVDLWNKVKSIEDIEEKIGIDIIKLFKASKNEIFVEEQNTTEKEPTVEAELVRHGEWKHDRDSIQIDGYCSCCGFINIFMPKRNFADMPYCPNCGAKMDGKENEK